MSGSCSIFVKIAALDLYKLGRAIVIFASVFGAAIGLAWLVSQFGRLTFRLAGSTQPMSPVAGFLWGVLLLPCCAVVIVVMVSWIRSIQRRAKEGYDAE